jgi:hypothetical protein
MGKRREPRTETSLPVRIFGTDAEGKVFSESVLTVDLSHSGAKLSGVRARIKPGDIIGMSNGQNKSRFSVQWVGQPATARAGQIGLFNLAPAKSLWEVALPAPKVDPYRDRSLGSDRRQHPRMRCTNSVQLHPPGQAPIWGKAVDLSTGGCFVEMPIPLALGTKVRIGLWLNENKLLFNGKVVNSRPGFGIGIQFIELPEEMAEQLRKFLRSISQIRS